MTKYDVFRSPKSQIHQARKRGFCWTAFFFNVMWLSAMKTPASLSVPGATTAFIGFIAILVGLPVMLFFNSFSLMAELNQLVGSLAWCAYLGANGNEWRRRSLDKLGWTFVASIDSDSAYNAIQQCKQVEVGDQ